MLLSTRQRASAHVILDTIQSSHPPPPRSSPFIPRISCGTFLCVVTAHRSSRRLRLYPFPATYRHTLAPIVRRGHSRSMHDILCSIHRPPKGWPGPPHSHHTTFCEQPVPWLACTPRGRTLASRRVLQSQRRARHDETWLVLHTASHRRAVAATYCLRRVALDNDRSGIRDLVASLRCGQARPSDIWPALWTT